MASRKNWIKQMEENPVPRAIREFTDREELRAAYHDLVQRCKAEDGDNCYVINYHGVGGIGKTTLLRKLQSEIEEKSGKRLNKEYLILNLDFETIAPDSVSALVSLRSQMISLRPNLQFPMFDEAIGKLRRGNIVLDEEAVASILEKKPLFNDVVDAVSEFVPGMSAVKIGLQRAEKTMRGIQRRAATDFNFLEQMEIYDEARVIKSLPYCFAHDINYGLQNDDVILLFFIDTYERLVTESEGSSKWTPSMQTDDWLCGSRGLIRNLPSSVFAIAGREKLKWKEYDAFWNNNLETHVIDHLSEEDSSFFFSKCGINSRLWHGLYSLTGGEPVFMDLCVDQYEDIVHRHSIIGELDYTPNISEFGENTSILVERHTRYVGDDMRDALYLAASMRKWNKETLRCAAESIGIILQPLQYQRLCNLTYVSSDDGERYFMHSIIAEILSKKMTLSSRKAAIETLMKHTEKHLEQEWITESICSIACSDLLQQSIANHVIRQGDYFEEQEQYEKALKWHLHALDMYLDILKGDDEATTDVLEMIGGLLDRIVFDNRFIQQTDVLEPFERVYVAAREKFGSNSYGALFFRLFLAEEMIEIDRFWEYKYIHFLKNRDDLIKRAAVTIEEFEEILNSTKKNMKYTNTAVSIANEVIDSIMDTYKDENSIAEYIIEDIKKAARILISSDDVELLKKAVRYISIYDQNSFNDLGNAYMKMSYIIDNAEESKRLAKKAENCFKEAKKGWREILPNELKDEGSNITEEQMSYAAAEIL